MYSGICCRLVIGITTQFHDKIAVFYSANDSNGRKILVQLIGIMLVTEIAK